MLDGGEAGAGVVMTGVSCDGSVWLRLRGASEIKSYVGNRIAPGAVTRTLECIRDV